LGLTVKKQTFTAAFISALLTTALAGALFVNSSVAASDGYPKIVVDSPVNGAVYTVNNVRLRYQVI
jgi:hypothetical protein